MSLKLKHIPIYVYQIEGYGLLSIYIYLYIYIYTHTPFLCVFFVKRDNESVPVKGGKLDPSTPEQHALFGALDPIPVCFLRLVFAHLKKRKKGEVEEEENYSLQTELTWKLKALSGTHSTLC